MRIVSAEDVHRRLDYRALTDRLEEAFRAGCHAPLRHHHAIETPDGAGGTLLLMPAWRTGRHIGVKQVTIFPDNSTRDLPAVMGVYFLLDATDGTPLAVIDGMALTVRRTAAASALAARFLARADSNRLLMVGAGALAPHLIAAHAGGRPIELVEIWNRNFDKAARLAERLADAPYRVQATADLEKAARAADIISCATLTTTPLIRGAWLKPGCHLDLVGAYMPSMRESDDEAVRKASLYVDTREGAPVEGGDIADPIRRGIISADDIRADLPALCRGERPGRENEREITLFKSVGHALEDLAAAEMIIETA